MLRRWNLRGQTQAGVTLDQISTFYIPFFESADPLVDLLTATGSTIPRHQAVILIKSSRRSQLRNVPMLNV